MTKKSSIEVHKSIGRTSQGMPPPKVSEVEDEESGTDYKLVRQSASFSKPFVSGSRLDLVSVFLICCYVYLKVDSQ